MDDSKQPGLPGEQNQSGKRKSNQFTRRDFLVGAAVGVAGGAVGAGAVAAIMWPEPAPAPAPAPTPQPSTPAATPTPAPTPPPAATKTISLPSYVTPVRANGFIMVDQTKCVGCRLCETECAIFHEGVPDLTKSRIRVHYFNPPVDVASVCQQCGDSPCIAACPPKVAALTKNKETGVVTLDAAKCTGCWLCVEPCESRSGMIRKDEKNMVVYGICDLCGGDPQCVKVCPSGALTMTRTGVDGKYMASPPAEIARQVAARLYGV